MPFLLFTSEFLLLFSLLSLLCCDHHMLAIYNWILLFMSCYFSEMRRIKESSSQFALPYLHHFFFSCSGTVTCESLQSLWARTEGNSCVSYWFCY